MSVDWTGFEKQGRLGEWCAKLEVAQDAMEQVSAMMMYYGPEDTGRELDAMWKRIQSIRVDLGAEKVGVQQRMKEQMEGRRESE